MTVLAAQYWKSNAELIVDVAKLGYIHDDDRVLDPTFGKGTWWNCYHPRNLTAHDRKLDGTDFRHLPYKDKAFHVAAYDPPYQAKGGRETATIPDMDEAYGMYDCPRTPEECQQQINDGMLEMNRLASNYVLVKCCDYVSSGKIYEGTYHTRQYAEILGMTLEDRFIYVRKSGGPQPQDRRQVHARNNYSVLYVFKSS